MDDLEFVRRCADGDKRAWDEFLKRYSRLIYCYIKDGLSIKGQRYSVAHIQDIFQEIFCSLINDDFRKLKTFKAKNGCSLASWLRHVTVNFTIDYLRRHKPVISIDQETEEGIVMQEALALEQDPIIEEISKKEILSSLKDCIDRLKTDEKYFLKLHFIKGVKLEDLRRYLKLSRPAIDIHKFRLLNRLRECFKSKGVELE
jgi:RNA polymerase sigma factor (sigma-70 family)